MSDDFVTQNERIQDISPYHYQRDRQLFNKQPRPAQANTSQPNQKSAPVGWGMSTESYWSEVFKDYLRRKFQ
ncbi:hypothetical protein ES703_119452 [subsurface metagenome]